MALNMSRHIELLKVYLDAYDNPESMKKRMDALEASLAIRPSEEGFPTRNHIMMEVSFMVKQKQKVMDAVGENRYMDAFQRSVKFLEKNPEPSKKKAKKEDIVTARTYTIPSFYTTASAWYVRDPITNRNVETSPPAAAPTPAAEPAPSETRHSMSYEWGNADETITWDSMSSWDHTDEGAPVENEAARLARTSQETAHPAPAAATLQLRSHAQILSDLTRALEAGGHNAPAPGAATIAVVEAIAASEARIETLFNSLEIEDVLARARSGREE